MFVCLQMMGLGRNKRLFKQHIDALTAYVYLLDDCFTASIEKFNGMRIDRQSIIANGLRTIKRHHDVGLKVIVLYMHPLWSFRQVKGSNWTSSALCSSATTAGEYEKRLTLMIGGLVTYLETLYSDAKSVFLPCTLHVKHGSNISDLGHDSNVGLYVILGLGCLGVLLLVPGIVLVVIYLRCRKQLSDVPDVRAGNAAAAAAEESRSMVSEV
jgi:hypothetical protein